MQAWVIVVICIIAAAIAFGAWYMTRRRRSEHLRSRFGPEYHRTLEEVGDRTRAERVLEHREKRVARLHIRPLTPTERDHFAQEWRLEQAKFVDDPKAAVTDADRLVVGVMQARGYPMADFDQRVEDISVDHPKVVDYYRQAREIALRHKRGQASTEDLRQAMVYYRALFDELLDVHEEVRR